MILNGNKLMLHKGDTLCGRVEEIFCKVMSDKRGAKYFNEVGCDGWIELCDQVAKFNGYKNGVHDSNLQSLKAIEDGDTIEFTLPEWLAQAVYQVYGQYFDSKCELQKSALSLQHP